MSSDADARLPLIEHLRAHAIRTDGPFTLRSGAVSDWYIDARQTTFDGDGAIAVGDALLSVLEPAVVAVGGMTMGADPIAMAAAVRGAASGRPLRAFSIRKQAKDHGTGGRLVGPVQRGDTVVIVDDTVTTGGALVEAIDVAVEGGLVVAGVIAIVDRSDGAAADRVAEAGYRFRALVEVAELGVGS